MNRVISIQNLNKFRWVAKDSPVPALVPAFRTGFWNVYNYTPELEEYLKVHQIDYRVIEDKYTLLYPSR